MKRFLVLFSILLLSSVAWADTVVVVGSGAVSAPAAPTYLVDEDCEGSGTPDGWVDNIATDGTVDWDYITESLVGNHSLRMDEKTGGDVSTYYEWGSGNDAASAYYVLQIDVNTGGNFSNGSLGGYFASSTGTSICSARINNSSGSYTVAARIGSTNGSNSITSFNTGDTIHFWIDVSNTDDSCEVYYNTSATKPAQGGDNYSCAGTGCGGTGSTGSNAQRMYFVNNFSTIEVLVDKIRIDDDTIGSNPL